MLKKKSWKTTFGGVLQALGLGLVSQQDSLGPWSAAAGQIAAIIGALFLGLSARDNNVSSEEAGIK